MDLNHKLNKNPGIVQANQRFGLLRGYVVDVNDPEQRGRVRVHIYGLDSDYTDVSTDLLYWAEPIIPVNGAFSPPEFGSRVWVMFEAGDMENPVYLGFGYANPAGRGTLPCDSSYGSEVPTEAWGNSHNSYPETLVSFKTGEGTVFQSTHRLLAQKAMDSHLELEDTGGKGIQIHSYHEDNPDATPTMDGSVLDYVPSELDGVTIKKGKATRTGWPEGHSDAPGEVQIQVPDLSTELRWSDDYTAQHVFQAETGSPDFGYEQHTVSGLMNSERLGSALEGNMGDTFFLNTPKYILLNGALQPPRRWTKSG